MHTIQSKKDQILLRKIG